MDNLLNAYKDKLTGELTSEPNAIIDDLKKDKQKFQDILKEKDNQIEIRDKMILEKDLEIKELKHRIELESKSI